MSKSEQKEYFIQYFSFVIYFSLSFFFPLINFFIIEVQRKFTPLQYFLHFSHFSSYQFSRQTNSEMRKQFFTMFPFYCYFSSYQLFRKQIRGKQFFTTFSLHSPFLSFLFSPIFLCQQTRGKQSSPLPPHPFLLRFSIFSSCPLFPLQKNDF